MNAAATLDPDAVLRPAERCVVREQVGKYLFYSARTGELHLVPPTGFYLYRLCDGVRTVADVAAELADRSDLPAPEVEARVREFLGGLLARSILEVADA